MLSPAKPLQPASISAWKRLRSTEEEKPVDAKECTPDGEPASTSDDAMRGQPGGGEESLAAAPPTSTEKGTVASRDSKSEEGRKWPKPPSYSKARTKAQATRLFAGLLVLDCTVIAVVSTWFLTSPDPAGEDWRRYNNGLTAYLPRISYVGATLPAWFLFSTGMPLGVWLSFDPFMEYLRRLVTLCHRLGVPGSYAPSVHCFFNCCCCCVDSRRAAITADLEIGAPLVTVAPGCTCLPYLPYVVATLGPLFTASMWGLATLAIISLAFGPAGALWHYVAAATFFWGMDALCGLVLFLQWRVTELWPERAFHEANMRRSSCRYKALRTIFYTMMFVMFIADWSVMGTAIWQRTSENGKDANGEYILLDWYFGYWGAIMQWTEISLISFFGFFISYDLAAWPCDPEHVDAVVVSQAEMEQIVKGMTAFEGHERALRDEEATRKSEILRKLRKSRGE